MGISWRIKKILGDHFLHELVGHLWHRRGRPHNAFVHFRDWKLEPGISTKNCVKYCRQLCSYHAVEPSWLMSRCPRHRLSQAEGKN